jgi:hypothetical protein
MDPIVRNLSRELVDLPSVNKNQQIFNLSSNDGISNDESPEHDPI